MPKETFTGNGSKKDFNTALICAIRYSIGRRTYMPSLIAGFVKQNLAGFADMDLACIKKDIEQHGTVYKSGTTDIDKRGLCVSNYGDSCDYETWMDLLDSIDAEMKSRTTMYDI